MTTLRNHCCDWVPCSCSPESGEKFRRIRRRTLVLCFDGTGDQFDGDNSNVVQFLSCLKKNDETEQLVYYQAGIGTYTSPAFASPVAVEVSKAVDLMVAWNLSAHVQGGYEFLMQNYTAGDKICLFGFSRGAYTARALAGMVQQVGLLPRDNRVQIPFAWSMYTSVGEDKGWNSRLFKETFSTDVKIEFVGVWDTVSSVGIIAGKELPFTSSNTAIHYFRHALALDEHRVKFLPNFYHHGSSTPDEEHREQKESNMIVRLDKSTTPSGSGSENASSRDNENSPESQAGEASENLGEIEQPKVLEVWFAGCHCDVGGGSVRNGTKSSLARIPLRWMIRECFKTNTGIIFNRSLLMDRVGIEAHRLWPNVIDRPPSVIDRSSSVIEHPPPMPALNMHIRKRKVQLPLILKFSLLVGRLVVSSLVVITGVLTFFVKHILRLFWFSHPGKHIRGKISERLNPLREKLNPLREKLTSVGKYVRDKVKQRWANLFGSGSDPEDERQFKLEEGQDHDDALSPEYDQLSITWLWWLLEYYPFLLRKQDSDSDEYYVRFNARRGREVMQKEGQKIKVHRSVRTRLQAGANDDSLSYTPRAKFTFLVENNGRVEKTPLASREWREADPDHIEWVD